MPFETQVVRHLPVLVGEALVAGLVIASARQQCAQPQQRQLEDDETGFGGCGRKLTDRDEPWAIVVALDDGSDTGVTVGSLNETFPLMTWLNSLPLVVRFSTTTINHLPATGLATDRLARAVGVVDPTPCSVVVGVASATTSAPDGSNSS